MLELVATRGGESYNIAVRVEKDMLQITCKCDTLVHNHSTIKYLIDCIISCKPRYFLFKELPLLVAPKSIVVIPSNLATHF
jgi:hypothetical protein